MLCLARKYHLSLIYTLAAFSIMLPWLASGYILTLDLVFTPQLRMPENITSSYLLHLVFHVLNFVLPGDVLEKLVLFLILVLSGAGMHRLATYIWQGRRGGAEVIGCYMAGLLYMINPFVYDRFMAGQYNVLLGYALLPWFVRALLKFVDEPAWQRSAIVAIWAVIISVVTIHDIGLMILISIVIGAAGLWRHWHEREKLGALLKFAALSAVIFLLASSYWLVPLVLGHGTTATTIDTLKSTNTQAFATGGGNALAKLGNVLSLQGFWGERQNLFLSPRDQLRPWGLFVCLIWALVLVGITSLWRARRRQLVVIVTSMVAIGAILGSGIFNNWLVQHVPFFSGYREPQKFVALIALGYALCAGWGVRAITKRLAQHSSTVAWGIPIVGLTLIIWGFTPVMFRGFDGQLSPRHYPPDWAVVNQKLDADHSHFQVLFLPWHLYMRFQFAGRIIANPAPAYFDKPIISSNDPEFAGVVPAVPDFQKQMLGSTILPQAAHGTRLGHALAALHIKYVLLDKDYDYTKYDYLNQQADLHIVSQSPTLVLYQNGAFKG